MPGVESESERAVREPRRLSAETGALQIELKTGVLRIAVEHLEAQGVKRGDKGDVRILAQRVAKREGPMGRQLGHQPVGDRLDTIVFLGLIRRRLRACDHARTVMLGSRRDRRLVGRMGLSVVLRGDRITDCP